MNSLVLQKYATSSLSYLLRFRKANSKHHDQVTNKEL